MVYLVSSEGGRVRVRGQRVAPAFKMLADCVVHPLGSEHERLALGWQWPWLTAE